MAEHISRTKRAIDRVRDVLGLRSIIEMQIPVRGIYEIEPQRFALVLQCGHMQMAKRAPDPYAFVPCLRCLRLVRGSKPQARVLPSDMSPFVLFDRCNGHTMLACRVCDSWWIDAKAEEGPTSCPSCGTTSMYTDMVRWKPILAVRAPVTSVAHEGATDAAD